MFHHSLLNCTDYALAGLAECGSAENKNLNLSEVKDTSTKKQVNGVGCRVNGVESGINGIDEVVNGVQNGVNGVTNGSAKFLDSNNARSNSQENQIHSVCGSPMKKLNNTPDENGIKECNKNGYQDNIKA